MPCDHRHRILWVNDPAPLTTSEKDQLCAHGFDLVTTDADGYASFLPDRHSFAAVVISLRGTGIEGLRFLTEMKAQASHPPVIIQSFSHEDFVEELCFRYGADGYLRGKLDVCDVQACFEEAASAGSGWKDKSYRAATEGAFAFNLWVVRDPETGAPDQLLGRAYRMRGFYEERWLMLRRLALTDVRLGKAYTPPPGFFEFLMTAPDAAHWQNWCTRRNFRKRICLDIAKAELTTVPPDVTQRLMCCLRICDKDTDGRLRVARKKSEKVERHGK